MTKAALYTALLEGLRQSNAAALLPEGAPSAPTSGFRGHASLSTELRPPCCFPRCSHPSLTRPLSSPFLVLDVALAFNGSNGVAHSGKLSISSILETVRFRDPHQEEFLQAVEEVLKSLAPVLEKHPE
jgi:hypothetical protein